MRFGKSIWYAKRINEPNAEIERFEAPIEIKTRPNYLTIMKGVTRGYFEIKKYGETAENIWTIIANGRYFSDKFNEGDVMWVGRESPFTEHNADLEAEYGNGATANAVIKNVAEANLTISILLERNQKQVKQ